MMRITAVAGISHRSKRRGRPAAAVHDDLAQRAFVADTPDRLWCTDITEHPTATGKVYCCAVLDVCTRKVVGWSIADHVRAELVVDAPQMAIWRRRPAPGAICHSDRGSQYTSWVSGHRLREAGLLGSMGRIASSVDNTMIESFWSTMQRELLDTDPGPAPTSWPPRSSNGSRPGTTHAADTPASACSPRTTTSKPFSPPPRQRHDHHTTRVRETGSGSSSPKRPVNRWPG